MTIKNLRCLVAECGATFANVPCHRKQVAGSCAAETGGGKIERQVAASPPPELLGRRMPYYLHGLRGLMDNALSGVVPASAALHS